MELILLRYLMGKMLMDRMYDSYETKRSERENFDGLLAMHQNCQYFPHQ